MRNRNKLFVKSNYSNSDFIIIVIKNCKIIIKLLLKSNGNGVIHNSLLPIPGSHRALEKVQTCEKRRTHINQACHTWKARKLM